MEKKKRKKKKNRAPGHKSQRYCIGGEERLQHYIIYLTARGREDDDVLGVTHH